jgi:hypothetical protein
MKRTDAPILFTVRDVETIFRLSRSGYTLRAVARAVDLPPSVVEDVIKAAQPDTIWPPLRAVQ